MFIVVANSHNQKQSEKLTVLERAKDSVLFKYWDNGVHFSACLSSEALVVLRSHVNSTSHGSEWSCVM